MVYTRQSNMDRDFQPVAAALREAPDVASQQRMVLIAVMSLIEASAFESLSQYLAEDIELHIHGMKEFAGSWYGYQDVAGAITANFSKVTVQRPVIEGLIQQGNAIALRIRETGHMVASGEDYEVRAVLWFEFEDVHIRRIDEFLGVGPLPARG